MRFLRHISKSEDENGGDTAEELSAPFGEYLSTKFSVPGDLLHALHSLSLSQHSAQDTPAEYAVPRVQRHLSSIGSMGPGFGGVVSKYGGASEILQVACRACAVGGGAVALAIGIQSLKDIEATSEKGEYPVQLELTSGESVRSKFVIGSLWDIPGQEQSPPTSQVARSITVVSSSFISLFPITTEGAPLPASTVLMFPGDTLSHPQSPPVYLQIHSSDTGDCPRQQSKFTLFFRDISTHTPYSARMMNTFYLSTLSVTTLMTPYYHLLITSTTTILSFYLICLGFIWLTESIRYYLRQCRPSWVRRSHSP